MDPVHQPDQVHRLSFDANRVYERPLRYQRQPDEVPCFRNDVVQLPPHHVRGHAMLQNHWVHALQGRG